MRRMRSAHDRARAPFRGAARFSVHLSPFAAISILASAAALAEDARAENAAPQGERVVDSAADDAAETAPDTAPRTAPDTEDLAWNIALLAASDFGDLTLGVADIGVDWEIAEGLSAGVFGEVLYASQDPDDALGGGGGVTLRWRFLEEDAASLFVDVGCGAVVFSERVPGDGSRFNFTPRVAFGARFDLDGGAMLEARVGWFHVSNAQTADSNPGFDGVLFGLGLSFPF
ncbi:MAG: hypothetical protein RI967_1050 [Planctomycetota bacterium]|jgi:hypothetical protein